MSTLVRSLFVAAVLVGCGKSKSEPPKAERTQEPPPEAVKPAEVEKELPQFVGDPIKQDANFPRDRWVRTVLFDGKTPYIGFTYVDQSKGNCIKGENISGLSPADIKTRLHAKFPSSSMEPIPEGHPMTLLTPEEIKQYDLPAKPEWVSYFEK